MFPAGDRHEATAAEEGGLVMERRQTETGCSQETTSSPPSSLTALSRTRSPVIPPIAHPFLTSGSRNCLPMTFDHTGQIAPPGAEPRVTADLWEEEGTRYFQVEARGVCVARREDNHMINGTKLLSAAGITRSRRDGILKSEKTRHVVKTGPMYLKGVWIRFERALELANEEKITESLYPLFVHDIGALLYHPVNQKPTYLANSQNKYPGVRESAGSNDFHTLQIDASGYSDKISQNLPSDAHQGGQIQERGPIESLSRSLIETLGLILTEVRIYLDRAPHYSSLESSCAALFFWDTDLGLSRGELDDMLQDSPQLRDTCLTVLVSISQFVSTSLICLISSERRRKEVLQSTRILTYLDQTANMVEQQYHSTHEPEQDAEALCQTLRTKIDTLIMLAPSLESTAEESFDDEEPRAIQYLEKHFPEQAYINSVSEKFPLAASAIVAQLGKLNWDRYNHVLHLQRETMQQELQMAVMEKARTLFNDSGLGVSLPAQSKAASSSGSVYAPSIASTRAEASHKRVPPLPAQARSGEPFTCEICNKQVKFQRTKAWKKHVFGDILAYACFFADCCNTRMFFEDSDALMTHLQDQHGMDVRISDVECPLCMEFTSGDRDVLALHIARHMEEIALAILPSGVESDEESAGDSASVIGSVDSRNFLEREFQLFKENSTHKGTGVAPIHVGAWQCDESGCGYRNIAKNTTCLRCGANQTETSDSLPHMLREYIEEDDLEMRHRFEAVAESTFAPPDLPYVRQDPHSPLEGEYKNPVKGRNSDLHFTEDSPYLSFSSKLPGSPPATKNLFTYSYSSSFRSEIDGAPYYLPTYTHHPGNFYVPPPSGPRSLQQNNRSSGPQDNSESSSEQRKGFQNTFHLDDKQLNSWSVIESVSSGGLVPPTSEPGDNSESSSKQQKRPQRITADPEAPHLFSYPSKSPQERGGQLESDAQYNIDNLVEQQSRPRDTPLPPLPPLRLSPSVNLGGPSDYTYYPSNVYEDTETSSKQQPRLQGYPSPHHVPTKNPKYVETLRKAREEAWRKLLENISPSESEPQDNNAAPSEQQSKPPGENKSDGASGTTPKVNTEYKEKLRKRK